MKTISVLILFSLLSLSTGSFSQSSNRQGNIIKLEPVTGYLKVHTKTFNSYNSGVNWKVFEGYDILNTGGKLVKKVSSAYEEPPLVSLPEGTYIISAAIDGGKKKRYEVKIEIGKITEVGNAE
jgi:hypothetical protein